MIGSKEISVSGCIRLHQEGNPAFKSVPNQTCSSSHCGDTFASREQLKKKGDLGKMCIPQLVAEWLLETADNQ